MSTCSHAPERMQTVGLLSSCQGGENHTSRHLNMHNHGMWVLQHVGSGAGGGRPMPQPTVPASRMLGGTLELLALL